MLYLDNMVPVAFWPYTSVVLDRCFTLEFKRGDCVDTLEQTLLDMFNAAGIEARADNKIVFEFYNTDTERLMYIGFYDWRMSVGFKMRTDDWNRTEKREKDRHNRLLDAYP